MIEILLYAYDYIVLKTHYLKDCPISCLVI